jgi:hypothetical protein
MLNSGVRINAGAISLLIIVGKMTDMNIVGFIAMILGVRAVGTIPRMRYVKGARYRASFRAQKNGPWFIRG